VVIDLAVTREPVIVGSIDFDACPRSVWATQDLVFIGLSDDTTEVIDVPDPTQPVWAGELDFTLLDAHLSEGVLYVAAGHQGLQFLTMIELPPINQVIEIPDPGLSASIRAASDKPIGDITVGDMESLIDLDASRQARGTDAPLIQSLEGLQTARNLTELNLNGGGMDSPNVAIGDFSPLTGLTGLRELHLAGNGLTALTLPEGLASLEYLDVRDNPITYLAVPASMDLDQLVIDGFLIEQVTILTLRIGPAMVEADGKIRLPVSGASGQRVKLQRSDNLVDWEDWQTMTLGGTGCGLIDTTGENQRRFYRVVEDQPSEKQ
jgi:hypothetical protein